VRLKSSTVENFSLISFEINSIKQLYKQSLFSVRLLPLSTIKNSKKKRQDLVNGQSDFNETNRFRINTENYIGQNGRINNSNSIYAKLDKNDMLVLDEDKTE
jgi:hypothetical protein